MLTTSQVPYSLRLGHDCPGHPGEFIRERDGATLAGRRAAVHEPITSSKAGGLIGNRQRRF